MMTAGEHHILILDEAMRRKKALEPLTNMVMASAYGQFWRPSALWQVVKDESFKGATHSLREKTRSLW